MVPNIKKYVYIYIYKFIYIYIYIHIAYCLPPIAYCLFVACPHLFSMASCTLPVGAHSQLPDLGDLDGLDLGPRAQELAEIRLLKAGLDMRHHDIEDSNLPSDAEINTWGPHNLNTTRHDATNNCKHTACPRET